MSKFSIKGRTDSESVIAIVRIDNTKSLYLSRFGEPFILLGIIDRETKKGFYYTDVFFKEQFVSWSSLVKID